jgi:peptide deformylase
MSVLPIYLLGTKTLKKKAKPVESPDDSIVKLAYDMFETMHKANGIGLAAVQVGDLRRVITIDISSADEPNAEGEAEDDLHPTSSGLPRTLTLINPEVLAEEGEIVIKEGCLSIPDVHGDVRRAEKVSVRFRDMDFKEQEIQADGLLARVILHEIDHLDGILFIDRMTKTKRSLLLPKLRGIQKGDVNTDYPVVSKSKE